MSELKTMKDIREDYFEAGVFDEDDYKLPPNEAADKAFEVLRQEVIKWIKGYYHQICGLERRNHKIIHNDEQIIKEIKFTIDWIKDFFNIKESDLKMTEEFERVMKLVKEKVSLDFAGERYIHESKVLEAIEKYLECEEGCEYDCGVCKLKKELNLKGDE